MTAARLDQVRVGPRAAPGADVESAQTKIITIAPAAPGWFAEWQDVHGIEQAAPPILFPVACWAHVEYWWSNGVRGARDVVAMVQGDGARNRTRVARPAVPSWSRCAGCRGMAP